MVGWDRRRSVPRGISVRYLNALSFRLGPSAGKVQVERSAGMVGAREAGCAGRGAAG